MIARAAVLPGLLLVACGEAHIESRSPGAPSVQTVITSAPTTSPPVAAHRPPSPTRVQTEFATVGDSTCQVDADCTLVTKAECCDCCPSHPMATSVAWLDWRDTETCPHARCEPCGVVECALPAAPALTPKCNHGTCTLLWLP